MPGLRIQCVLNWPQSNCLPRAASYFSSEVSPPPPICLKVWSLADNAVLGGCVCVEGCLAGRCGSLGVSLWELQPNPNFNSFSLIPDFPRCGCVMTQASATVDRSALDIMPSLPLSTETKLIFLFLRASVCCFVAIVETNTSRNPGSLVIMIEVMLIKIHWRHGWAIKMWVTRGKPMSPH